MINFQSLILAIFASYGSCFGFAICLNVPPRALNASGITGIIGWLSYQGLCACHSGHALAYVGSALSISLISLFFAHRRKMPVTMTTIPALMPLVPGGTAYEAVKALTLGHLMLGLVLITQVIIVAGALAIGFMLGKLAALLIQRLQSI